MSYDQTTADLLKENKDLQQQLLLSQKREMDLREALSPFIEGYEDAIQTPELDEAYAAGKRLLSTPPTLNDLHKWRDAEIEKSLGEPVSEIQMMMSGMKMLTNIMDLEELPVGTKLYAKKG
jgi:hypothetical protein